MSDRKVDWTVAARATVEPSPYERLIEVDTACEAHGMPPLSPWWRFSLREFYDSGKPWGIFLVGRGGGKSTSLERVAGSDAYYTARRVPPGQTWTWPFISIGPDDANRRVDGIEAVYRAIRLPFVGDDTGEADEKGKAIKVRDGEGASVVHSPRAALSLKDAHGNLIRLMSIAGTVGNISGPSTIGMTVDEAAKLLDDKKTHVNPLSEIIASGSQTSRGRAGWRAIVCSSAWELSGTHYQLVKQGNTETNFVARIGHEFLSAARRGFESVAARLDARGDALAARLVREHAATLTADSHEVPTWVANPTLGNPEGVAWDGAALATLRLADVTPESALDGVPRIVYWLRENASVPLPASVARPGPLADVAFAVDERAQRMADVVVGVAPPDDASTEWGLVAVGLSREGGLLVLEDASGPIDGYAAAGRVRGLCARHRASVIVTPGEHARRVEGEILAAFAGAGVGLAPVAPQDTRDPVTELRVGPLRTLYLRVQLRHAPGLDELASVLHEWRADTRSARVEAVVAAVLRLVACYPWLAAAATERISAPAPLPSMLDGAQMRGIDLVRKLGGRK